MSPPQSNGAMDSKGIPPRTRFQSALSSWRVKGCPFEYQCHGSPREISSEDGERLDLNESLVFAIFGMEMRRIGWSLKYIRTTIPKNRVTSGITSFDFTCPQPAAAEAESFRGDPAAIRAPRTRSLAGQTAAIGLTGMSNGGPMEATAARC